jgi:hypothetical protein
VQLQDLNESTRTTRGSAFRRPAPVKQAVKQTQPDEAEEVISLQVKEGSMDTLNSEMSTENLGQLTGTHYQPYPNFALNVEPTLTSSIHDLPLEIKIEQIMTKV